MRGAEIWLLNYLFNSLWQVPLVFAAIWAGALASRPLGPEEEHRMWCGGLLMATLLPMVTVNAHALVDEVRNRLAPWVASVKSAGASITVAMGDGHAGHAVSVPSHWLDVALWMYAVVVLYSVARTVWGLWQTHQMRLQSTPLPLETRARTAWFRVAKSFGLLATDVATVPQAEGPMTIGIWRRTLILPDVWLETVAEEDLEAAIAHECAHMQRRDFAKNLLYRVLTLSVSYHPVVWLMHSRVVETREILCDAMAADAVAGRERYARSLLRLAASLMTETPSRNLHAIGIFDAHNFERRVMNLTMTSLGAGKAQRIAVKALCAVLGFGTTVSALAMRMQVATTAVAHQDATQPQTEQPASLPQSVTVGVPRSAGGQPVQTFKMEVTRVDGANATSASEAPLRLRIVSPVVAEPEQTAGATQVSAGVMAGNILTRVQPVYPQAAKDAKIQGAVVLDAVIGKDGTLKSLKLVSGPDELTQSAWTAVSQWTYKPYLLNGQPTEVETTITVNYHLAE